MAAYFLLCMRLTYFKEWYWDGDVQKTYSVFACSEPGAPCDAEYASTWELSRASNFYQDAQPTSHAEIDDTLRSGQRRRSTSWI